MAAENSAAARLEGKGPRSALHGVVACGLTRVTFLRGLEVVQRIEKRQQPRVGGSFEAR